MKQTIIVAIIVVLFSITVRGEGPVAEELNDKVLVVNASSLLLRQGPGKDTKALLKLFNGRALLLKEVTDREEVIDGIKAKWYKVSTLQGDTGYVFSGYVKEPDRESEQGKYRYKDPNVIKFCANLKSYNECSESIHNYYLSTFKFITKINGVLKIKLKNGKEISFADYIPKTMEDEPHIITYAVSDYWEELHYCIITAYYWEGISQTLVNIDTGKKVNFWNTPIFVSEDKQFMIAISDSEAYIPNGIQIIKIAKGNPVIVFEQETGFGPINCKWINSQLIELTAYKRFPNGGYIYNVQVANNGKKWMIIE